MNTPTEDQIRRRAYEIYLKHGQPGRDTQNWLQAERELQQASEDVETATASWERKSNKRSGNGKRAATAAAVGANP